MYGDNGLRLHGIGRCIRSIVIAAGMLTPACLCAQPVAQPPDPPKEKTYIASPGEDMFIELIVPVHQIYLGETIRIEYDVYIAASLGQLDYSIEEPDFFHWYSISGNDLGYTSKLIDGKRYTREPHPPYFITPYTTGKTAIPQFKAKLPYVKDPTWITNDQRIIEVIPLPTPIPPGFIPGNVGQFSIEATASTQSLRVGDVLSVMIEISGNAPASHIDHAPYQLKTNPTAFKSYPIISESMSEKIIKDELVSKRKYRLRLLALKAGQWTIDPFELVYFDPKLHQYQTIATNPITVNVTNSGIRPNTTPPLSTTRTLDEIDIIPIHLKNTSPKESPSLLWMLLAPFVLGSIVLTTVIQDRRRKTRKASEESAHYNQKLEALSHARSSDEQLSILRELLTIRYHLDIGRSTDKLQPKLQGIFTKQQAEIIVNTLNELRMTSYSTQTPLDAQKLEKIINLLKTTKYMEPKP